MQATHTYFCESRSADWCVLRMLRYARAFCMPALRCCMGLRLCCWGCVSGCVCSPFLAVCEYLSPSTPVHDNLVTRNARTRQPCIARCVLVVVFAPWRCESLRGPWCANLVPRTRQLLRGQVRHLLLLARGNCCGVCVCLRGSCAMVRPSSYVNQTVSGSRETTW